MCGGVCVCLCVNRFEINMRFLDYSMSLFLSVVKSMREIDNRKIKE